ncbi:hypothetical protein H8E88_01740 [candidate division KSB1 bacterium]|nr:hypothetical protein [candidate division KSB1 bacterium]
MSGLSVQQFPFPAAEYSPEGKQRALPVVAKKSAVLQYAVPAVLETWVDIF